MQYDGARTATVVGTWSEDGKPRFPVGASLDLDGDTVVAKVLRSGSAQRVDYEETSGTLAETVRSFGYRAAVAAPVTVGGRLWGVLAGGDIGRSRRPTVSSSGCATSPNSSRRLWPMPTPTRSWPRRVRGSSRLATPNACGSSATCTMAATRLVSVSLELNIVAAKLGK